MMLSQKKLQKVQPKIKAIQEKYKGKQAILGQKLMELYKEEKVNPM
jgi:YidC/Oxa1 family membrane protein insertase